MAKQNDQGAESIVERMPVMGAIVTIAEKCEAAWPRAEIASMLLVAHVTYAQRFLANADIAASLRQIAEQLEASPQPPRLEPELQR